MRSMDLGSLGLSSLDESSLHAMTESKVAYLCLVYIGSNESSRWDECARALGLSQREAEQVAAVARVFEMSRVLEQHAIEDLFVKGNPAQDFWSSKGKAAYDDAARACKELGVDLKKLAVFWNNKLRLIDGGFLATQAVMSGYT